MNKAMRILAITMLFIVLLFWTVVGILRWGFQIDIFDWSGWKVAEDGTVRYHNAAGTPLTGWQPLDGNRYYFAPSDGAMHTGWLELEGNRYYFTPSSGAMHIGWLELEGNHYFLNDQGVLQSGWVEILGTRHYLDASGAAASGWQTLDGNRYYLSDMGAPYIGLTEIDQQRYLFDDTGVLLTGWQVLEDRHYYFADNGQMLTGWQTLEANTYFTAVLCGGEPNEKRYYLAEDGAMHTGWLELDGKHYYLAEDGGMHTGWLELEQAQYYLREDGTMAVGEVVIDGLSSFFASTGKYVIITNRNHPIPEGYTPDLVDIQGFQIDSVCKDALEQMIADCNAAGYYCVINNAYRSYELQQYLWYRQVVAYMEEGYDRATAHQMTGKDTAVPGTSEHQLGLAVDIVGSQAMYDWLAEHCVEYGFILRYPADKTDITGIIFEPWHFRYVGVELAQEITSLGLCMEEYMDMLTASVQ